MSAIKSIVAGRPIGASSGNLMLPTCLGCLAFDLFFVK
jgi:hypothetical protein